MMIGCVEKVIALIRQTGLAAVFALIVGVCPAPAIAQAKGSVEARLERIERLVESGSLLKMLQSLESLESELRNLRGEIELQTHQLGQLRQRQRELYLDTDSRLARVESGGAVAAGAASGDSRSATSTSVLPSRVTVPAVANATAQPVQTSGAAVGVGLSQGAAPVATTGGAMPTTPPEPSATTAGGQPAASPTSTGIRTPSVTPSLAAGTTAPGTSVGAASVQPAQVVAAAPSDPVLEQQAYKGAFAQLKSGDYDSAIEAFLGFLAAYPVSEFADNAQYWLGETYYVTRRFEAALAEFQQLMAGHPKSQKLTHAMLKIGYIHDELGQPQEAKRILVELTERFPKTTAAGLARKRLQRLRSQ